MDIIDTKFKTRRQGFYFWTTRKNFLSLHYTRLIIKRENISTNEYEKIARLFFDVFVKVMHMIGMEGDQERENYVLHKWAVHVEKKGMDHSSFGQIFKFCYKNKISIEELCVYRKRAGLLLRLWVEALLIFSTQTKIIDDFNSHCSKIYTNRIFIPRYSAHAGSVLFSNWDRIISDAQKKLRNMSS